jgi:RIO kinase 2
MSRLAAMKEFAFMKVCPSAFFLANTQCLWVVLNEKILHENGFPVPKPIDQSRHCLIMSFVDAFPLSAILSI